MGLSPLPLLTITLNLFCLLGTAQKKEARKPELAAKHHVSHQTHPYAVYLYAWIHTYRMHTDGMDTISAESKPFMSFPQTWEEGIWPKKPPQNHTEGGQAL